MTNSEWTLHVFESKTRRRRGRRRWTHSVDIWPSGVTRHCMYIQLDRYSLSVCVCEYVSMFILVEVPSANTRRRDNADDLRAVGQGHFHFKFSCHILVRRTRADLHVDV